jgi:tetratricopeptide (TPR) repeat protein
LNPERRLLAGGLIVLAALAAYGNTFSAPFIFDDFPSIVNNPTIRHLGSAWLPPHDGSGVTGRPLVNFSLAVNYALGGLDMRGYHATNLAIHILAALTLFGIVRRTLLQISECGRGEGTPPTTLAEAALPLAFTVALLWAVHPLQTESVTCIIQRTESLMGLFYLLTLYCFIRAVEGRSGFTPAPSGINPDLQPKRGNPPNSQLPALNFQPSTLNSRIWSLGSIVCCLLGMATKEVMVSAPLMVLLYDRTFVAGTFREAWKKRWRYFLGLACTWILLGYLVATVGGSRGKAAGFGLGITPWTYALTQCRAIIHYLKLSVWPHPLILDYGVKIVPHLAEVLPQAIVLVLLVLATIFGVWRHPVLGFVGAWFFAILAPSSSVVPLVTQAVAEHRMYLPLAAVVVWVVLGLYRLLGRRAAYAGAGLAVLLTGLTLQRNEVYRSDIGLWSDTTAKCPDNERAFYNLGCALEKIPARIPEAIAAYEAALRINPDYTDAHNNLGNAFFNLPGHLPDAIDQYEAVVRLDPGSAEAHSNLGTALLKTPGALTYGIGQFEAALRLNPDLPATQISLGKALLDVPGRLPDAMTHLEAALQLNPNLAEAHLNLGMALFRMPGHLTDAIVQFQAVLRINPDQAEAHNLLGSALAQQGNLEGALAQFADAVQIAPEFAGAHYNLGNAFAQSGRLADALREFQIAVQLDPNFAPAHHNLGLALYQSGRLPDAIEQFELALQLKPDFTAARNDLEQARKAMAQPAR